jgi:dienelactone hydrolase
MLFRAILESADQNLFFVDWSSGARTLNYYDARMRVNGVGKVVGQFIEYLRDNYNVDLDNVSIVGFSLGGKF